MVLKNPAQFVAFGTMPEQYGLIIFLAAASSDLHGWPLHEGRLNRSGPSQETKTLWYGGMPCKPDPNLLSLNYDRDLHLSPGVKKHFLQFLQVFLHVHKDCLLTVDRPGLKCIGSGIYAVNDYLVRHYPSPSIRLLPCLFY
jgi:hypothetical protein